MLLNGPLLCQLVPVDDAGKVFVATHTGRNLPSPWQAPMPPLDINLLETHINTAKVNLMGGMFRFLLHVDLDCRTAELYHCTKNPKHWLSVDKPSAPKFTLDSFGVQCSHFKFPIGVGTKLRFAVFAPPEATFRIDWSAEVNLRSIITISHALLRGNDALIPSGGAPALNNQQQQLLRSNTMPVGRVDRPFEIADGIAGPSTFPRLGHGHKNLSEPLYKLIDKGAFGSVYRKEDPVSGEVTAVKVLERAFGGGGRGGYSEENLKKAKREVNMLFSLSHPCVVRYIKSEGWDDPNAHIKISMELMDGSVESLKRRVIGDHVCIDGHTYSLESVTALLLKSMLSALDFLVHHCVVHRDLKPANILYSHQKESALLGSPRILVFKLGDFGESKLLDQANTWNVGTLRYCAPELLKHTASPDDTESQAKVDIWSLFATMIDVVNVGGFRSRSIGPYVPALVKIANNDQSVVALPHRGFVKNIQHMGIVDVAKRASAAQMIKKLDMLGLKSKTPYLLIPHLDDYELQTPG